MKFIKLILNADPERPLGIGPFLQEFAIEGWQTNFLKGLAKLNIELSGREDKPLKAEFEICDDFDASGLPLTRASVTGALIHARRLYHDYVAC